MKFITFERILFIAALLLAICGAYYSIVGIATLFSGAMLSVGIMAGAIEFAKFCSTTFLYRYWVRINNWLKLYLIMATFILMVITSIGIFGYLSSAYQKSASEFKISQEKIEMVDGQKVYLIDKISQSKIRIKTLNDMRIMQESRLNDANTNSFLTRNPLQLKQLQDQTIELIKTADKDIKIEQDKIQSTTDDIQKISQTVNEMKFASAGAKDIKTFQFVADQLGTTLDNVARWFILTLIFVFDPLSIALILAYNVSINKKVLINDNISIKSDPVSQEINLTESTEPLNIITEHPKPSEEIDSETRRIFKL